MVERASLDRRGFLARTGVALAAAGLAAHLSDGGEPEASAERGAPPTWATVRAQFRLSRDWTHLGGLLLASHPAPVRNAIDRHRRGLDAHPVQYLHARGPQLEAAVLREAAAYLGASPADIALTDSTTMGLGLLYNGIDLRAGQEALTTRHDFFATHESLRLKAARTGASVRMVPLYDRPETASADRIVNALVGAVRPATRVIALTWVHSSTGVKLPVRRIADALAPLNRGRDAGSRILLCVDGVHGLGVEDVTMPALGCDFFVAGCHKWLFGPRGTGIVWGRPDAWRAVSHTIPSFSGPNTPGNANTPGGFHSFEHRWALAEAFAFHRRIGKARVESRVHSLARRLRSGLAAMRHVHLYTPHADELSAGIVCFDVNGMSPGAVVDRLAARRIVATVTPYAPPYARLSPGLLNTPSDVDRALAAIRSFAP
jgi:selenocysteine lyase/cysteine desulfurase